MKTCISLLALLLLGPVPLRTFAQTDGTIRWTYSTGDDIWWSSPAIGLDGTIYVGSWDNRLHAVNPDGSRKWTYSTSGDIRSSPAIGPDGTIYVGSTDDHLHAVNPDGSGKWTYETGHMILASPAVGPDGTIYVASWDDLLHAVNPDGSGKWTYPLGDDVDSCPAIGPDGTIYVGSQDDRLHAVNPDGSVKWTYSTGGNVDSSPAIGADGTIYVGSWDNLLHAVNPDGSRKWTYTAGGAVQSSPSIGPDGTIYVGSYDTRLHAVNPDGTGKWTYETGVRIVWSSPAIGTDGTIYIGSDDNRVHAVNPDGSRKWTYLTGADVRPSPAIGTDGTIYVGSTDNRLYAIYGSSSGLATSPWPKYRNNNQNTGVQLASIALAVLDPIEFAFFTTGASIEQTLEVRNSTDQPVTLNGFTWDHAAFSLTSPLPIVVPAGSSTQLTARVFPDATEYYESTYRLSYESEGKSQTASGELGIGLFLDDGGEQAYAAHQAMAAFEASIAENPASVAATNNRGVLYRLLGETETAEQHLSTALSKSLNANYGFAGIKMNRGVVESDQGQSAEAKDFYDAVLEDVDDDESNSVLAPQTYYNMAWELYQDGDLAGALTEINKTLAHGKVNDYFRAKAYVLRGVIRHDQGDNTNATTDLQQAVLLDPDGPIGRMAQDNLHELSTGVEAFDNGEGIPEQFVVLPNFPNPFHAETRIRLGLPQNSPVEVHLYNTLGRRISTLFSGRLQAGWYELTWDGTDDAGRPVASGMYLLRMKAGSHESNQEITLIR